MGLLVSSIRTSVALGAILTGVDAGMVRVSLTFALTFSSAMSNILKRSVTVEGELTSVEKIFGIW